MIWFSEIVRLMELILFAEIVRLVWFNKPEPWWNKPGEPLMVSWPETPPPLKVGDGGTTIRQIHETII